ncbi:MAG: hypothetical protein HRU24_07885 [Gammaproteobacteria bacterium]|nr:hypothetical protein [Gammaproteobacteria bacterium]
MNHNPNDDLNDQRLSDLYQRQSTEQPSASLDKKILALTGKEPNNRLWFNKLAPYSVAASAVLVSLLFLNNSDNYQVESIPTNPPLLTEPASLRAGPEISPDKSIRMMEDNSQFSAPSLSIISEPRVLRKVVSLSIQQQQKLEKIDQLLLKNKPDKAILLLKKFKQQYPNLPLEIKYQKLLDRQ